MGLRVILCILFGFGGFFVSAGEVSERRVIRIEDSGADVRIPTPLWNLIQEYVPDKSLSLASVKIRLKEKTKGVLLSPDIEIEMPRGGGEIDLSRFVRNNVQGTFSVFFDYEEIQATQEEKVYFVSRAKKRKLDQEIWGAGCNKFMEIKDFMSKVVSQKGLEVNTTRQRHLSVLGGTFIFFGKNQIAQVTFRDKTATHLFCENLEVPSSGPSKENGE